jgi:AraC-like DNA-binding protein
MVSAVDVMCSSNVLPLSASIAQERESMRERLRLPSMDGLGALLDGPRARDAFLLRTVMRPPWAIRVQDEAPLSVVGIVAGTAWIVPDGGPRIELRPGDVAVARGPQPYLFADDPETAPQVIIHPGQRCTTPDGVELATRWLQGVRTWGNDPDGPDVHLVGTYQLHGEVGGRLLDALPPLLVVRAAELASPLVGLLGAELARDEPGQEAVLDRLLDLLLIATLRAWFAGADADAPGWYRASSDPVVGPALRLLQHHPAQPWTVAALAAETGVSRAALARRFSALVGEPPMAFLTGWRLALAADLLLEPGATIGAVARQVGYGSPYALSTAFKRHRGVSPKQHRLAALAS